jgi:hypothetical protein
MSTGIQHELLPRVSVSGTWIRTTAKNSIYSYNTLRTWDDYTTHNVVSPLDGSVFPVYNLKPEKLSAVAVYDTNDPDGGQQFQSFEFNVNARLSSSLRVSGGSATERTLSFSCSVPDNPNLLLFCDQRQYDIPYRTQVKLNAQYTLPWQDIGVATTIQSLPPALLPGGGRINWQVLQSTRYAADCVGPCTPGALVIPGLSMASLVVPLTPSGTEMLERVPQFDISVNKAFRFGGRRLQARVDVFNLLNSNAVLTARSSNFATPTYRQPATILDARTVRLGVQLSY